MTWGFTTEISDEWKPFAPLMAEMLTDIYRPPSDAELLAGNLNYLREAYAVDFITLQELDEGLDSVLRGGPINVPNMVSIGHRLRCKRCRDAAVARRMEAA